MKSQPIPNTNSGHKKNPQVSEIWSYFEHDMSWWKFGQKEREQQAFLKYVLIIDKNDTSIAVVGKPWFWTN